MNKFRSCYTKCANMFLGFTKYYSITDCCKLSAYQRGTGSTSLREPI